MCGARWRWEEDGRETNEGREGEGGGKGDMVKRYQKKDKRVKIEGKMKEERGKSRSEI